ncbi:GAF and ANTAR domain-containing protein [Cellulomonas sp. PhB143]|uniref:GAF and ANTAR domain-containing protein n=1 Tax=Cellulomonas sp. PhB143 TaxID=2485186 RepID=UPI000F49A081|nr:GAF and ANTAR domain-containing protein [Cellulomonas sp. PhB143]ROS73301.1 GAF domain-containing protein [Cellulomonas sp. PhB143]
MTDSLELSEDAPELGVHGLIAQSVRTLADEPSLEQTLARTAELAVALVDGCDAAGISFVARGGRIETPAATDDVARRGDELQYALGEGPCLDAVRDAEVVSAPDLADDPRWSRWGSRVVEELGVRSMLCVQLFTTETRHGALNLYATEPHAFPEGDYYLATTFAAVAAAAVAAARTEEQLESAVQTRTIIGQAQGLMMERYKISATQAFSVLSRLSQEGNVRLADVARRVVDERTLPGA